MSNSETFDDGTIDDEDREIMRQALSEYSRDEIQTLRQFIDTLIAHPMMRRKQTLRLILHFLNEGPVSLAKGEPEKTP